MASVELSDAWLELVLFQAGGLSFALEADQVLSMRTLVDTSMDLSGLQNSVILSLSELLTLPSDDSFKSSRSRILEIAYQESSFLVTVEEPVFLHRCRTNALHPFPEMVHCRLCQPAVLALIIFGEQLITLLDPDKLTLEKCQPSGPK